MRRKSAIKAASTTWSTLCCSISVAAALNVSCGRDTTPDEERLPGRSRSLLAHDWPHPRDYEFSPSQFKPPDPDEALIRSSSGLRAYVLSSPADPVVRITAALPLGRLYERPGEAGASELLTQLLTRDARDRSQDRLSLRLASLGTRLEVENLLDVTSVSLEVLAEDWAEGLAVMIDLLRRTDFQQSVASGYRTGIGYATPIAEIFWWLPGGPSSAYRPKVELERILGGYPLAPPDPGLQVSIEAVQSLAARALRANLVVLGIGGNVPRAALETELNLLSSSWEVGAASPQIAAFPQPMKRTASVHTIDAPGLQGWIAIGHAIGPVPESDRASLAVLGEILGTRLNVSAREMRGLANSDVFVLPETTNGAGLVHIQTGGRPEAVAPLVKFSLDEVARMATRDDPISEEELQRAKAALVAGTWQSALDGPRRASSTYAVETVRRGGVDRLLNWPVSVQAVTDKHVKEAALKYLSPSEMTTVVVGPMERIRQARHPRWPVDFHDLQRSAPAP
jgi:predicted Zn-dependent peptidase